MLQTHEDIENDFNASNILELSQCSSKTIDLTLMLPPPPQFEHVQIALDKVDADLYSLIEDFLKT